MARNKNVKKGAKFKPGRQCVDEDKSFKCSVNAKLFFNTNDKSIQQQLSQALRAKGPAAFGHDGQEEEGQQQLLTTAATDEGQVDDFDGLDLGDEAEACLADPVTLLDGEILENADDVLIDDYADHADNKALPKF